MSLQKIAAIIPAHNEEKTIVNVIRPLKASPYVGEILVVSDGSTDKTVEIARSEGVTVQELSEQGGKGQAMLSGFNLTTAQIIGFFDADLIGLTTNHIEQLVLPVISSRRVMNVGLRDKGVVGTFITKHLPLVGGERVMLRKVMDGVPDKYLGGFMVESALNYFCRSRGYSYGAVILKGLTMRRKYQKVGLWRAVIQYVKMWYVVAKAMLIVRAARLRNEF
ncbi:MAG: glycosyltransferase family 2 protein [Parcubacteria group bacterium]|nr:glycosyltransferase family 2 protein [Parcubacteria group bacterium]